MLNKIVYALIWGYGVILLSGCVAAPQSVQIPPPLRAAKDLDTGPTTEIVTTEGANATHSNTQIQFENTPIQPRHGPRTMDTGIETLAKPVLDNTVPINVNVEGLPVAAFINEVFGNLLNLSFNIAPAVKKQRDLVTLRLTEAQTAERLYDLAENVLQNYGVTIIRDDPNFLQFVATKNAPITKIPILARGSALPSVPSSHRPIFQFVPLKAVATNQISTWIRQFYQSPDLQIMEDRTSNALIVSGPPEFVQQVIQAIELLDQPVMRGQYSTRIEPIFLNAEELGDQLEKVLAAQGYGVNFSVRLLPIPRVNVLIAFATTPKLLNHVKQWAASLDKPGHIEVAEESIFFYQVKNTQAESIAEVLEPLLQKSAIQAQQQAMAAPNPANQTANRAGLSTRQLSLVVDKARNALIYQGLSEYWIQLLPILQEMDKPAKQVLIEVTVAEVTLTNSETLGVNWLLNEANIDDDLNSVLNISNQVGGLSYQLNYLGQTQALFNLLATSSNSRVTVLSSPRLMVKSGESASINIGDEVPILTSQTTSSQQQDGNTALLQQVQYRSTGMLLNIEPVVHGNNQIDLKISQEISNVNEDATSAVASPIISNRSIETNLTLSDGGSVLLGGLISSEHNNQRRGVPKLKDVPLIGNLFKTESYGRDRSELVMLIVPYIVGSNEEAQAITEAFRQRLSIEEEDFDIDTPIKMLPVNTP